MPLGLISKTKIPPKATPAKTAQTKKVAPAKPARGRVMSQEQKDKMAAARAAAKKAGGTRKKKPTGFKAPSDFKPAFFEIDFKTEKDGLLGPKFKVARVKGNWDKPENDRYDLAEYDVATLAALAARLQTKLFVTNVTKRMSPNTRFTIVIRVIAPSGILKLTKLEAGKYVESAKTPGKMILRWFDPRKQLDLPREKRDPDFIKIKAVKKFLDGAFTQVQLPPSKRRKVKDDE